MEFWVTVATVLPILALPLVLTARVHVAHTLYVLESPLLARMTAGGFALILIAIYAMESWAVMELADASDVTGHEWAQGAAVGVVLIAGSVLIFSPGSLLLQLAFAGPGLGFKSFFSVPQLYFSILLLRWQVRLVRRKHNKEIEDAQLALLKLAEEQTRVWDIAKTLGVLVQSPTAVIDEDSGATVLDLFDTVDKTRETTIDTLAATDARIWMLHYDFDRKLKVNASHRDRLRRALRKARESNIHAVWRVFDDWTAAEHRAKRVAIHPGADQGDPQEVPAMRGRQTPPGDN